MCKRIVSLTQDLHVENNSKRGKIVNYFCLQENILSEKQRKENKRYFYDRQKPINKILIININYAGL